MIDNKYHEEYTYNHKRIVVDIARLPSYAHPGGVYEVMAYYKGNGKELACKRTPDFEEAVKVYEQMKKDFPAGRTAGIKTESCEGCYNEDRATRRPHKHPSFQ